MANFPIFGLSSPILGERMSTTSTGGSGPRGRSGRRAGSAATVLPVVALLAALATPGSAFAGPGPDAWRTALAAEPDRTVPLAGRSAELRQRSFTLHGLPLRRAHATVLADADGQRVVREALPDEAPELLTELRHAVSRRALRDAAARYVPSLRVDTTDGYRPWASERRATLPPRRGEGM